MVVSSFLGFSDIKTKTDEAGRFILAFNPGGFEFGGGAASPHVILARDPERNLAAAVDVDTSSTNATLRLAPGFVLAGRATDPSGTPVTNAQAQLVFRTWTGNHPLGESVRANAEGRFEIQGVPATPGLSVTVSAAGYGWDAHDAQTGTGGSRRVELDPFQLLVANQHIAGVVLDRDDKPVGGVSLHCYGAKQPDQNGQSDAQGHFSFDKACAGHLRISANSPTAGFGSTDAEAGDTNITIHMDGNGNRRSVAPRAVGLRGKPLPDLAVAGLTAADAPLDRPVLVLLIDVEERPSRQVLRSLVEQAPTLKQKGVAVVVLQSGDMAEAAFTAWRQEAAIPFPVGQLKAAPEVAQAAWGARALPWFILTDKAHRVTAEGFPLEDLDAKLGEIR
jgi:hypothetical protein